MLTSRHLDSRRAKPGKTGFISLLLALLVAGLAGYAFMSSPFFSVSKVEVRGNLQLSSEELVFLSQVTSRDNIFRLNLQRVRKRIGQSPRIESVTVARHYPSTLRLTIVERRGVALLPYSNYFLELDGHGVPISIVEEFTRSRLPLISGHRPAGVSLGKVVRDADLVAALRVPASLSPDTLAALSEIRAADLNDIVLYTTKGVRVRWGAVMEPEGKAELLDSIVASLSTGQVKARYIDISVPNMPVVAEDESGD